MNGKVIAYYSWDAMCQILDKNVKRLLLKIKEKYPEANFEASKDLGRIYISRRHSKTFKFIFWEIGYNVWDEIVVEISFRGDDSRELKVEYVVSDPNLLITVKWFIRQMDSILPPIEVDLVLNYDDTSSPE